MQYEQSVANLAQALKFGQVVNTCSAVMASADDYDYDGEGQWDEWADEDDYDWEGDDDDEAIEEYDEGEDQIVDLDRMGPEGLIGLSGNGRQQNVGIHTIELYYPQFYFKHLELEEYDARPDRFGPSVIGKYTKGIGMIEGRCPTDDEDCVSYAMTTVHRLLNRMERQGFNETGRFTKDGQPINIWNAVGRLDVGSESLIDRSKSMKTYCMDLFERYGDGEANIEGVDMYNACYGGQAAGLVCLSWVESDRWDGRYGLSIATDVQDVEHWVLFCAGASCAGTLFFPDAPLAHHSLRASCILHRFDFFKPVGWYSMAPITDGKYSVNAYMDCVDMCHQTLKRKRNGQSIVKSCGFNIFHTGGGYHIVKKAYERMIRSDDPNMPHADRAVLVQQKLMPGTHILKIIGPTHTVSSFCNMCSTIMNVWDEAIGKTLVVFTYGSGSAASMYETRFDDLPWMEPYNQWKIGFYRESIHLTPWDAAGIHTIYCEVWMKFGYTPFGRQKYGIDPWAAQEDAYYLMEIDPWGRRFYHQGGIAGDARDPKWTLQADIDENRRERKDWGPIPAKKEKKESTTQLQDKWVKIEEEMLVELDPPAKKLLQVGHDRVNPTHKIVCTEVVESPAMMVARKDEAEHTYWIVGTFSDWVDPVEMSAVGNSLYTYELTIGENGWEEFYILQDNDADKKIFPARPRSWKSLPCVGPHTGRPGHHWFLDARDRAETPLEDVGVPGDVYNISFSWKGSSKLVEWTKLEEKTGTYPSGKYYISGTQNSWDFTEMTEEDKGKFSLLVTLQEKDKLDFYVVRNKDRNQLIYPEVELDIEGDDEAAEPYGNAVTDGKSGDAVLGVDSWPSDKRFPRWSITESAGDYKIVFTRNPDSPDDMSLTWEKQ